LPALVLAAAKIEEMAGAATPDIVAAYRRLAGRK
jgi:hypothetical protein